MNLIINLMNHGLHVDVERFAILQASFPISFLSMTVSLEARHCGSA